MTTLVEEALREAGVTDYADLPNAIRGLAKWKHAVLDQLANTCMDAPLTEPPFDIIGRITDWHVAVATDPAVNGGKVLVEEATLQQLSAKVGRVLDMVDEMITTPINMVLHCPECHSQHVDAPEECPDEGCDHYGTPHDHPDLWHNPPHRTHLCAHCGCHWRPADVATNGVAEVRTRGAGDTWPPGLSPVEKSAFIINVAERKD